MKIILLLLSIIGRSSQLSVGECGTEARRPQITDIAVQCGTSSIDLAIEICPVLYHWIQRDSSDPEPDVGHGLQSNPRWFCDSTCGPLQLPYRYDPCLRKHIQDYQCCRDRAFRFIEQQNETVSTYYLHCIIRLCEKSACSSFLQCNHRRKRNALDTAEPGMTKSYTISSSEIITKGDSNESKDKPLIAKEEKDESAVGLGVAVGVLAFACLVSLCVAALFYKRLKN
ncbi:hypothetical protein KUCAC02_010569 [Chaenocephalus aceratus]|uniref:Uncharacterized protein n=1 Tax=Chaenocephalus aceratus TaxID=36190 RepID=A0ACB9VZT3_CHAAC|nr:hypothetical protein KUCAC02_010569 [Chaenocephalus aceratus]